MVYPGWSVRNTFLDCDEARPSSLEDFYQERLVASCPVSQISEPGDHGCEAADTAARTGIRSAVKSMWTSMRGRRVAEEPKACAAAADAGSTPQSNASVSTKSTLEGAAAALVGSAAGRGLAAEPQRTAADLPSRGSEGHRLGDCKPCAFFNSKGCKSGHDCQFCHLCDAGEKKRRQKVKRAFFASSRSEAASTASQQGSIFGEAAHGRSEQA